MRRAKPNDPTQEGGDVVDFDDALLDSCSPEERAELLTEARILAYAFSEGGAADELEHMAATLSAGRRDAEMGRAHARKVAAALKHLARNPWNEV